MIIDLKTDELRYQHVAFIILTQVQKNFALFLYIFKIFSKFLKIIIWEQKRHIKWHIMYTDKFCIDKRNKNDYNYSDGIMLFSNRIILHFILYYLIGNDKL